MSIAWRIALTFLLVASTLLVAGAIYKVALGALLATGLLLAAVGGIALARLFWPSNATMSLDEAAEHLALSPEEVRALVAERKLQVRWRSGEWQVTRVSLERVLNDPALSDGIRSRGISLGEDVFRGGPIRQAVAVFIALLLRGLAMWVYVPATVLTWGVLLPVRLIRRRPYPTLRLYITVIDQWFVWIVLRTILRPVTRALPTPRWPEPGDSRPITKITDAW